MNSLGGSKVLQKNKRAVHINIILHLLGVYLYPTVMEFQVLRTTTFMDI